MAANSQVAVRPKALRDPLDDRIRRRTALLDPIFNPSSILVIGDDDASDPTAQRISSTISKSGFAGKILLVGPQNIACEVGVESCPSLRSIPTGIDLAIVTGAADRLVDTLEQCAIAGIKATIVTVPSSDAEYGSRRQLYSRCQQVLRGSRMRVLGPNCSVLMKPSLALNVSTGSPLPVGGTVALISQSAALCHTILQWSFRGIVGFSAFVSASEMLDVDWGDLIDYFGADPDTRSIILFIESIGNPRSFMSAAREVALNKPIIAVKAGRSEAAACILTAHTDSPPLSDEVLDAALRRVGVLRVNTLAELFSMADVLSKMPHPQGPRLGIVSNAISLTALAIDSVTGSGAQIPQLSSESRRQLGRLLQSRWRTENPVHVPASASADSYAGAARIVLADPNCDGLLLLTASEGVPHPDNPAEPLIGIENPRNKPVLACALDVAETKESQQALTRACIPIFNNVHLAGRAFGYMWQYTNNLREIYQTPSSRRDPIENDLREMAAHIIGGARLSGRFDLTESESRSLLAAYGIDTLETRTAASEEDAIRASTDLGFPVTMEVLGAGGPQPIFTLADGDTVRRTWRFLEASRDGSAVSVTLQRSVPALDCHFQLASWIDPQFGPVLLCGLGSLIGDALQDRALALPPLNVTLAERMLEQTRVYTALRAGACNRRILASLIDMVVRFSQITADQSWLKELSINPILLAPDGCVGLNPRASVYGAEVSELQLPRPAIRPYPVQYVGQWETKRGDLVTIRPILPEDEPLMVKFHERLSDQSVYLRYFQLIGLNQRTQHDRLTRICFIDYDREMALVAEHRDPATEERRIVGLGNLGRVRGQNEGEVAAVVSNDYQGHGLGTELMRRLVQVARAEKMERVIGTTMLENKPTIAMLKRVGFQVRLNFEEHVVDAKMTL